MKSYLSLNNYKQNKAELLCDRPSKEAFSRVNFGIETILFYMDITHTDIHVHTHTYTHIYLYIYMVVINFILSYLNIKISNKFAISIHTRKEELLDGLIKSVLAVVATAC